MIERGTDGALREQSPTASAGTQAIPARIVVGVTGHRRLEPTPQLVQQLHRSTEKIVQMAPPLVNTPLLVAVLSPLAEGADRLAARELLRVPGSSLEVVLPLEKNEYMLDFESNESKREFEALLAKASSVRILSSRRTRDDAYYQVGKYVVDHCDVLIALWDGHPAAGQGGTADVVEYARRNKCPLIWIPVDNPEEVVLELYDGLSLEAFHSLDKYNSERVETERYERRLGEDMSTLARQSDAFHLSSDSLRQLLHYVWQHYVRADMLAMRYQHRHYRAETGIYLLAVFAVAIAALQIIFFPDQQWILVFEVLFMLAALGIIVVAQVGQWHEKWIDYRFLAERFRSAFFMSVADLDVSTPHPRYSPLALSRKHWMMSSFATVWSRRPQFQRDDASSLETLKDLVSSAWLDQQIKYHKKKSREHGARYHRMIVASYVLFALTLVAGALHVADIGPHSIRGLLGFCAIVLPAVAASIAAIRTHRDYHRNSIRSAEMANHLEDLKSRLEVAKDREDVLGLVSEVEETMLHENEDWRVVVRFHRTDAPA